MAEPLPIPLVAVRLTARALLLGERIDTAGLERSDLISTTPLAFRVGSSGYAVLFRYGVVVLIGLSPIEEDEVVRGIGARITGAYRKIEDETATVEVAPERDDQVVTGGSISLKDLSPPRVLVIADVLAKNVALVRCVREVVGDAIDVTRDERALGIEDIKGDIERGEITPDRRHHHLNGLAARQRQPFRLGLLFQRAAILRGKRGTHTDADHGADAQEGDQRRRIDRPIAADRNARNPAPASAELRPATVMERREAPG